MGIGRKMITHILQMAGCLFVLWATLGVNAMAQSAAEPAMATDPKIAAALQQISAQRIQANIEKLVSFGTRLTLSAQAPNAIAAGHGIGAAREWIKSEFERYSKDSGGWLEGKPDSFSEGP